MANAKEARIDMYMHCKKCFVKHEDGTWSSTEELAVGWTKEGFQVVCEYCGNSIIDMDFKGQKVEYYGKPRKRKNNEN